MPSRAGTRCDGEHAWVVIPDGGDVDRGAGLPGGFKTAISLKVCFPKLVIDQWQVVWAELQETKDQYQTHTVTEDDTDDIVAVGSWNGPRP